jgi:copper oxidase (laccase) domain-containing protein
MGQNIIKRYKYVFIIYNIIMNEEKIKEILEENVKLKEELEATKEHLKKYTAPSSRKEYYEKNKDVIKERNRKYKETTNYKSTPEQRKEEEKVRPS